MCSFYVISFLRTSSFSSYDFHSVSVMVANKCTETAAQGWDKEQYCPHTVTHFLLQA